GRAAYYAALLCYAAAVYRGSGSALLAAVPVPVGMALCPTEFFMQYGPRFALRVPMIAAVTSLGLFGFAWRSGMGWWGLAVAPCGPAILLSFQLGKILRSHDAFLA